MESAVRVTKMKSKKKKLKAFHQKTKIFRANEPRIAVLMWGVSQSISQLSHVPQPVMLLKDDFKAYSKTKIDNHFYNKENMPGHFKFKDYCPLVFRNLRERFGIEENYFARSFQVQPLPFEVSSHSGAKFFQTQDKLFFIKTIESEEVEMLHQLLPKYHQYIVECHADTLLPQYMAMYRLTVDSKEYYYLVLRSILSCTKKIHKKYDLKGSKVDREAKDTEKAKELPTFKDNDILQENVKISIGEEQKTDFMAKLKKDVEFLSSLNVMDYSLLIGIHDTERPESEEDEDGENDELVDGQDDDECQDVDGAPASPTSEQHQKICRSLSMNSTDAILDNELFAIQSLGVDIYYMGVIDVLTYYGATKKAAHAAKTVKHGSGAELSTVKPQLYAQRFMEFIDSVVE